MFTRRRFMQTLAAAGTTAVAAPIHALTSRTQASTGYFGAHPFIDNHPDSVFIYRTKVDGDKNAIAKKQAGLEFTRSVIVPKADGVPLTHLVPIKPNIRVNPSLVGAAKYATVSGDFVGADVYFTEGVIEGLKELGLSANQIFLREVNGTPTSFTLGYTEMSKRTGVELRFMGQSVGTISANDLVWTDTPENLFFRKMPHLWPINSQNSWLLNIAKMKTHGMCVTLCAKNLQGTLAIPYQQHCAAPTSTLGITSANLNPKWSADIKANFDRHKADKVPRWDRPGSDWNCGLGMETWASRNTDNNAALAAKTGLHIIEAVYGRDGDFSRGPNPSGNDNNQNGDPLNYMMNYIIFGKNAYHVDIVGHWLAGHEPGNIGLFHLAKDRGLAKTFNPVNIPVYEWKADGTAALTPLTNFTRTPLKTYYLQRNYSGQTEPFWHLVNEPYTYPTEPPSGIADKSEPRAFVLHQNHPNPFNPYTAIEYDLPRSGYTRLEVYNSYGQLMDVLVDGYQARGAHMAVWNSNNRASGTYFYRFRFGDFTETKKMTLLR
ncbi:MAG: DUF362 domain-containing protein [Candidatus Latescibacter sp.]|nr:DUF362 domain-containing protein [Candidatus Latescibacter sp.]